MKHGLLALAAILALAIGAPASAQYMYIDVNNDGVNTSADVLSPSVTSVDVWVVTNKSLSNVLDYDSPLVDAVCPDGGSLTINSYQVILTAPQGGVSYGAWTDNMGFPIDVGNAQAGNDKVVGWGSGTAMTPGAYKLGTLVISVTGTPTLTFATSTSALGTAGTSFGSLCGGALFDNTMYLGQDWFSIGPTRSTIPVTPTTWGRIKSLYNH
jgi:hypothetical protein